MSVKDFKRRIIAGDFTFEYIKGYGHARCGGASSDHVWDEWDEFNELVSKAMSLSDLQEILKNES